MATHARDKLVLLETVSARFCENLGAFSAAVNRQEFCEYKVLCPAGGGRCRTGQSGRPRPL